MITLYIILGLLLVCGILVVIVITQSKLNRKAKAELQSATESIRQAAKKAERLQTALEKQAEAEVKAHEERKDLAGTADGDLVHRARHLFGGVQDRGSGSSGNN
jgi:predicted Holliday junction resolvase-like endonuclease